MIEVPLVRLDPDLPAPAYARPGDAGADLLAREGCVLAPGGGRATVPTGMAIALPEGYAGLVQPRSGLAARHGVTCLNAPGLIDAGYRGEIAVVLLNTDPTAPYEVRRGDRIAQLVVYPVERAAFVETDELAASSRYRRLRPHWSVSFPPAGATPGAGRGEGPKEGGCDH